MDINREKEESSVFACKIQELEESDLTTNGNGTMSTEKQSKAQLYHQIKQFCVPETEFLKKKKNIWKIHH